MTISPKCDIKSCKEELQDFGAILLSPPGGDKNQDTKKYHICKNCYNTIASTML